MLFVWPSYELSAFGVLLLISKIRRDGLPAAAVSSHEVSMPRIRVMAGRAPPRLREDAAEPRLEAPLVVERRLERSRDGLSSVRHRLRADAPAALG